MATEILIYRYHIDLKPPAGHPALNAMAVPETRTVEAMEYRESEGRYIFDDSLGTVLTIRTELVDAIQRGEQVDKREVEEL